MIHLFQYLTLGSKFPFIVFYFFVLLSNFLLLLFLGIFIDNPTDFCIVLNIINIYHLFFFIFIIFTISFTYSSSFILHKFTSEE